MLRSATSPGSFWTLFRLEAALTSLALLVLTALPGCSGGEAAPRPTLELTEADLAAVTAEDLNAEAATQKADGKLQLEKRT